MRVTILALLVAGAFGYGTMPIDMPVDMPVEDPSPTPEPSPPPSACAEEVFGYVDPDNCAVIDVSVAPQILAGPFGFGAMEGGSFLNEGIDNSWAAVAHYLPAWTLTDEQKTARLGFNGLVGLMGADELCARPGAPLCGTYVKTCYKPGCQFLKGESLLMGALPMPGTKMTPDGLMPGCEIDYQESYCSTPNPDGTSPTQFAVPTECNTCPAVQTMEMMGRRQLKMIPQVAAAKK